MDGADFSDSTLFFSLFLTVIPSPETYLAAENIHNRRQLEKMLSRADTNAPQLMDSQALLYLENKTHTHTHTLIMQIMRTQIHREHQSQF